MVVLLNSLGLVPITRSYSSQGHLTLHHIKVLTDGRGVCRRLITITVCPLLLGAAHQKRALTVSTQHGISIPDKGS